MQKYMPRTKKTLYDRLGGIYEIAALVDHFSENILKNDKVGINSPNPQLRHWSRYQLDRLPGLKWMRTLWVASITGGPYKYDGTFLGAAHKNLKITEKEFLEVADELANSLKVFQVPEKERLEVMQAFIDHMPQVVAQSLLS
jgi:hemoglobin